MDMRGKVGQCEYACRVWYTTSTCTLYLLLAVCRAGVPRGGMLTRLLKNQVLVSVFASTSQQAHIPVAFEINPRLVGKKELYVWIDRCASPH